MKIAIEGCCHGELDKIYETLSHLEKLNGFKVDLLIICGDFQAVRNYDDLQAMAVPPKFQKLNTFYKYYSGEKRAPVLTIFIGGNHEASNFLQELPYGGWVAPNIYYLGYAGIIQVGGLRIGGISGIYKDHDYCRGHFEQAPYTESTKRSVYHVRNLEVFRLKQVSRNVDIFLSHDWPVGIYHHGDWQGLVRFKPFFKKEIEENTLGSKPCADILAHIQPTYWFAAHLHAKFSAHVEHAGSEGSAPKTTKFLALDKCLPRRRFLQILDLEHKEEEGLKIKLDPEWLTILQNTDHLLSLSRNNCYMPGPGCPDRYDFTVTDEELKSMTDVFGGDLTLPENFTTTAPPFMGRPNPRFRNSQKPLYVQVNPQTTLLCTMLDITDPNAKILGKTSEQLLSESSIGLQGEEGTGDDDGSDGGCDENDGVPSFIDSSMDASQNSISSSWDSFHTANDTKNGNNSSASPGLSSLTSSKVVVSPKDISVEDDDDEFQSILSAQKKNSVTSTPLKPTPSSTTSNVSSSSSVIQTPLTRKGTIADRLRALNESSKVTADSASEPLPSQLSKSDTFIIADSNSQEDDGDDFKAILEAQKRKSFSLSSEEPSVTTSSSFLSSSTCSRDGVIIGAKSSSPESSGQPMEESAISVPRITSSQSVPVKRNSEELELPGQKSEPDMSRGSAGKKLKRRNVSMYSEPGE